MTPTLVEAPGGRFCKINTRRIFASYVEVAGRQLPGFPGGAYVNGERAAFRHGDTTVVLTLLGDGRQGQAHLPWLLGQAGARTE
jgi:hypothetical protein